MRKIGDILTGFESLPQAGLHAILQGRVPLIIAPHPDDESLGCGGLIAAACAAGLAPAVIILTDGSASHPESAAFPPRKLARLREHEACRAAHILGLPRRNLHFFRQPDGRLAAEGKTFERIVEAGAAIGGEHGCGVVIGPWGGDPHCDHEAAARIAACIAEHCGVNLLSYPVWGWLRDAGAVFGEARNSGWRLDITGQLRLKSQAIAAHESQHGDRITDCPNGFRLPQNLLEIFARPFEVYIA